MKNVVKRVVGDEMTLEVSGRFMWVDLTGYGPVPITSALLRSTSGHQRCWFLLCAISTRRPPRHHASGIQTEKFIAFLRSGDNRPGGLDIPWRSENPPEVSASLNKSREPAVVLIANWKFSNSELSCRSLISRQTFQSPHEKAP